MKGGNITDITQREGIKLLSRYWKTMNSADEMDVIFVGDVHGDFNQFIAPLIQSKLITISSDEIEEHIEQGMPIYTPKYIIDKNSSVKVVYLGDMVDEWIFSRSIVYMLHDLLKTIPNNVKYIYGNHDLSIISRYYLFKSRQLDISEDIPCLWNTLKKELNYVKNLKIVKNKAFLDGDEQKGSDFIFNYCCPLFEHLFTIFKENLGTVSLAIEINKTQYMISHTTWTIPALKQLISTNDSTNANRLNDFNPEQKKPLINETFDLKTELLFINDVVKHKSCLDYKKLSDAVNKVFRTKTRLYLSKNLLTYTRTIDNAFLNHIVGHSPGFEYRDQHVNSSPSTYDFERKQKLSPTIISTFKIYYFDFGCSAGYDHDEISRPDYVYTTSKGMFVSNLPALSFISLNGKDALLIMKDKTPRSSNKIKFE